MRGQMRVRISSYAVRSASLLGALRTTWSGSDVFMGYRLLFPIGVTIKGMTSRPSACRFRVDGQPGFLPVVCLTFRYLFPWGMPIRRVLTGLDPMRIRQTKWFSNDYFKRL
jgi:hypothetical protein